MVRELKFRAWDSLTKTWFRKGTFISEEGYTYRNSDPHGIQMSGVIKIIGTSNLIITQYTGLKDKNGKEIYEGDIFKYTWHERYLMSLFTSQVGWIKDSASFGYLEKNNPMFGEVWHEFANHDEFVYDVLPYIEIIGNIYENPELV